MHTRPASGRRAFSLIELLVVIAIIAILAALLIPAVSRSRTMLKRAKAQHEVMQILTAFKAYNEEYGKWPVGLDLSEQANNQEFNTGLQLKDKGPGMLAGKDDPVGSNPKEMPFLSGMKITGDAILDPWNNPYKYMCDFNTNGILRVQLDGFTFDLTNIGVVVWSRGPDGEDDDAADWADNPKSF